MDKYLLTQVDTNLYRWRRPSSDELAAIARDPGISAIIDLEGDAPDVVAGEKTECGKLCIMESYLRFSGINRPSSNALREAVDLIRKYQAATFKTLVHCKYGVDRTGYVIAAYRILIQQWPLDKAYEECLEFGHHWYAYSWWKSSLKELTMEPVN